MARPASPSKRPRRRCLQAAEIGAAREAFGRLSDAVIAYADSTRTSPGDDVATVYCPMVKKCWLQKNGDGEEPVLRQGHAGLRREEESWDNVLSHGLRSDGNPLPTARARQRVVGRRPRGPHLPDRGGERLVSRRLEERTSRPHGLRSPLRAPHVRRIRASRLGVLPAAAGGRRAPQRIDQRRSHELLGGGADRRRGSRALARVRSHGLPPAGADRRQVRQPA